jgi:hypothetical protein
MTDNIIRGWSPDLPTEEGFYWFYGDLWMGLMGSDFNEDNVPEARMVLVEIQRNIIIGDGSIVPTAKFNKEERIAGWLGYWAPAEMPAPPYDGNYYFKSTENKNHGKTS